MTELPPIGSILERDTRHWRIGEYVKRERVVAYEERHAGIYGPAVQLQRLDRNSSETHRWIAQSTLRGWIATGHYHRVIYPPGDWSR